MKLSEFKTTQEEQKEPQKDAQIPRIKRIQFPNYEYLLFFVKLQ